jgi:hypothetical protein
VGLAKVVRTNGARTAPFHLDQRDVSSLAPYIGRPFKRQDIPTLYGLEYNPGIPIGPGVDPAARRPFRDPVED